MKRRILFALFVKFVGASAMYADVSVQHADLQITLPSKPVEMTTPIPSAEGAPPRKQYRLMVNDPNGAIIVWHQNAESEKNVADVLQRMAKTIVKTSGGEEVLNQSFVYQGHPGRLVIVPIPAKNGYFRVAYFYVNGKYYQIMAVGPESFVGSEPVSKMFKSVQFPGRKAKRSS